MINRINRPLTGLYPCLLIADKITFTRTKYSKYIAKLTNDEFNPVDKTYNSNSNINIKYC